MFNITHISGIIGDIINTLIDAILQPIFDLVAGLLNFMLAYVYSILFTGFCVLIDAAQSIFKIFAGTQNVIYSDAGQNIFGGNTIFGGTSGNMVFDFLLSATVTDMFTKMIVLALFLLIIFSVIAIIKQEYSVELSSKDNNKIKILKSSGKALFTLLILPVVCVAGIYASNQLLIVIDKATGGNASSMSARIFVAAGFEANRARIDEKFYYALNNKPGGYQLSNTFNGYFSTTSVSDEGKAMDVVATKVDAAFLGGYNLPSAWKAGDVFGEGLIKYNMMFFGNLAGDKFDYKNFVVADYYYDLWKFNYVVAAISGIALAFLYLKMLITLSKRLFEIIILFIASPAVVAMRPLDDGQALTNWKKQFISKVLMVYGPVVAMNLYLSIFGMFTTVDSLATMTQAIVGVNIYEVSVGPSVALLGTSWAMKVIPGAYAAYNIMLCLFMIAGAMVVDQTSKWVSDWIGSSDLLAEGKEQTKQGMGMLKTGLAAGSLALGGAGALVGAGIKGAALLAKGGIKGAKGIGKLAAKNKAKRRTKTKRNMIKDNMSKYGKEMEGYQKNIDKIDADTVGDFDKLSDKDKDTFNSSHKQYGELINGGMSHDDAKNKLDKAGKLGFENEDSKKLFADYEGKRNQEVQNYNTSKNNYNMWEQRDKDLKEEVAARSTLGNKKYENLVASKINNLPNVFRNSLKENKDLFATEKYNKEVSQYGTRKAGYEASKAIKEKAKRLREENKKKAELTGMAAKVFGGDADKVEEKTFNTLEEKRIAKEQKKRDRQLRKKK